MTRRKTVPQRYIPSSLDRTDTRRQKLALIRSRKAYKKGMYISRPLVASFRSRPSPHVARAKKQYQVNTVLPNQALARATRCSVQGLEKIMRKGEGAYFSSGSRPNQSAASWGIARLASAITGGKASAVDFSLLQAHCQKNSPALQLATKAREKYKNGTRRVPQRAL